MKKIIKMHLLSIIGYKNIEMNVRGNILILAKLFNNEFKTYTDYVEYGKQNNVNTWSEEAFNDFKNNSNEENNMQS